MGSLLLSQLSRYVTGCALVGRLEEMPSPERLPPLDHPAIAKPTHAPTNFNPLTITCEQEGKGRETWLTHTVLQKARHIISI
jgi:hypothetical protein